MRLGYSSGRYVNGIFLGMREIEMLDILAQSGVRARRKGRGYMVVEVSGKKLHQPSSLACQRVRSLVFKNLVRVTKSGWLQLTVLGRHYHAVCC